MVVGIEAKDVLGVNGKIGRGGTIESRIGFSGIRQNSVWAARKSDGILADSATRCARGWLDGQRRRLIQLHLRAAPGQTEFARKQVVMLQPRQLARAQVEADDVRQITPAETCVEVQ